MYDTYDLPIEKVYLVNMVEIHSRSDTACIVSGGIRQESAPLLPVNVSSGDLLSIFFVVSLCADLWPALEACAVCVFCRGVI